MGRNVLAKATNNRLNNIENTLCQIANQQFVEQKPLFFERKIEFTQVGNGGGQGQPMFMARILEKIDDNDLMS